MQHHLTTTPCPVCGVPCRLVETGIRARLCLINLTTLRHHACSPLRAIKAGRKEYHRVAV